MLKLDSYLDYLETLVVSLLDERGALGVSDVRVSDPDAGPSLRGFTVSPFNARAEIQNQRANRAYVKAELERLATRWRDLPL